MSFEPAQPDPWSRLRRFTAARIATGRSGGSTPTGPLLAFNLDHALARDAVHAPFDAEGLAAGLRALPGVPAVLTLTTAAADRAAFLQRPELGRKFSAESHDRLAVAAPPAPEHDLAVLVSDGLSALAAHRQATPLLAALLPRLRAAAFTLAPLCVVRHARVALLDETGPLLRARLALILLGERPGLGTPDSLGAYFEFAPRPGRSNAERNCVSNIHAAGLAPAAAAAKLAGLLIAARAQRCSGIALKDDDALPPGSAAVAS